MEGRKALHISALVDLRSSIRESRQLQHNLDRIVQCAKVQSVIEMRGNRRKGGERREKQKEINEGQRKKRIIPKLTGLSLALFPFSDFFWRFL
jgi:hypothetical protein